MNAQTNIGSDDARGAFLGVQMVSKLLDEPRATADLIDIEQYIAPAPAKPKRITRKTREALAMEYQRGFDHGSEAAREDDGGHLIAFLLVNGFTGLVFFGLGAWLF